MLNHHMPSVPPARATGRFGFLALTAWIGLQALGGCGANNYWGESSWGQSRPPLYLNQQPADDMEIPEHARNQLSVEVRDVNVMARELRITGRVTNHYGEVVTGIRYRVELLSTDGDRSLATEYVETDAEIQPGAEASVRIQVESIYTTTVPRLSVEAQPIELGGSAHAAPEHWSN